MRKRRERRRKASIYLFLLLEKEQPDKEALLAREEKYACKTYFAVNVDSGVTFSTLLRKVCKRDRFCHVQIREELRPFSFKPTARMRV